MWGYGNDYKVATSSGEFEVRPITPDEVAEQKKKSIPPQVIEAWNTVIARNYKNGYSKFTITELAVEIRKNLNIDKSISIDGKGYFVIEEIYRKAGWKVTTDTPGYNESYDTNFTFTKR